MYIACAIVLVIAALFMIATVLLQSSDDNGMSSITGQSSNSFLAKAKNKTIEAKLELGTKVAAIVFVVVALVMCIPGIGA